MRIISGKYKAKQIVAPAKLPVRPTTDFAKTALFNILNNIIDIEEAEVLDLFAGTGNITYEFLSRYAKHVTAVDVHNECCAFIAKTLEQLRCDNAHVVRKDVYKFLDLCGATWDIIFADPPYDLENKDAIVRTIFDRQLLNEDGILVLEHGHTETMDNIPHFRNTRIYGHVAFSFFENENRDNAGSTEINNNE